MSAAGSRPVGQAHAQGAEPPRRGVNSASRSPPVGAGQGTRHGDGAAASLPFHLPRQAIRPDYERRGVRARRCTGAVRRCARFDHRRAWLTCGFSPRISYSQINQPRIGPDAEPLVFRSFVDHVLRQAQSVGTARVSCAVTRSGQGPRNLAAMMTRRNVTARASDASVVVVYPWARSRVAGHSSPAGPCSAYQMVTTLKHVQLERHRPLHGVHQPPTGGPSRTTARHWIGAAELGPQERRAGTRPAPGWVGIHLGFTSQPY